MLIRRAKGEILPPFEKIVPLGGLTDKEPIGYARGMKRNWQDLPVEETVFDGTEWRDANPRQAAAIDRRKNAMAKKATAPAVKVGGMHGPCAECGGPARGPRAHNPGCSRYRAPGSPPLKAPTGAGRRVDPAGLLRGMSIEELAKLRSQIDNVMATKLPELDEQIASLKELRDAIKKA